MRADRQPSLMRRIRNGLKGMGDTHQLQSHTSFPTVECFRWLPPDGRINFGDHLAEIVVDATLATRGLMRAEETARSARLLSIGSVMHFARDGDTVWGTGINGKIGQDRLKFSSLDVRAVRGPRTAEILRGRGIVVPEVFGDPALLIPQLLPSRFTPLGTGEPIFVPNLNDLETLVCNLPVVSPLRGWNYVISRIVASRLVLASSLHGIVLAEAYGIPARYVRLSEREGLFKYLDYYEGTGRMNMEHATSIDEGLEMGGSPPITRSFSDLAEAFPFDLWNDTGTAGC